MESSPNWGGQEERLIREAVWLREQGHQILVICQPNSEVLDRASAAGLQVATFRMRSAFDPLALVQMVGWIFRFRPHLIHAHSPKDAWLSFWFHRLGIPVVRSRNITLPQKMPPSRGFIYRHGCRRVLASAAFIRDKLVDHVGVPSSRVDVIGECVNLEEFFPGDGSAFRQEFGIAPQAPLFGIVAMLRGEKGHMTFLKAAIEIAKEWPEARFVIVGKSTGKRTLEQNLLALIEKHWPQGNAPVILTGFRRDVPVVMRALDVLVVPSTHDAQTLVIPQAFATGKPVIGSRVGGIPELVHQGKNGLLVKPGDVDELVQAMRFFLQHPKAAREMGQAGLELARRELSYEVKMRQLQDSYAKAIGSKSL